MTEKISLRDRKKARTKLNLLQAGLNLIGEGTFRNVFVEDICQQAEVSKVTFFKFFPQKEDMLIYFMSVWQAECYVELEETPKRGWAAVRHIFAKVADQAKSQPGIMLSLISFLSEQKMHPWIPVLSDSELQLLFPNREDFSAIAASTLDTLFRRCVKEAREDGELSERLTEEEAVALLFTTFYGSYLSAHLCQSSEYMAFYDMHLKPLMR